MLVETTKMMMKCGDVQERATAQLKARFKPDELSFAREKRTFVDNSALSYHVKETRARFKLRERPGTVWANT